MFSYWQCHKPHRRTQVTFFSPVQLARSNSPDHEGWLLLALASLEITWAQGWGGPLFHRSECLPALSSSAPIDVWSLPIPNITFLLRLSSKFLFSLGISLAWLLWGTDNSVATSPLLQLWPQILFDVRLGSGAPPGDTSSHTLYVQDHSIPRQWHYLTGWRNTLPPRLSQECSHLLTQCSC